jgi:methionine synthase II (cobalamin-independent)
MSGTRLRESLACTSLTPDRASPRLDTVAESSSTHERGFPWQPGTATGIGSLPGTDPMEAAHVVAAELADFPHLAELPARGPGADMIGRAAGLLIDIAVDTTPRGWRLSAERPGRDIRRARSMLSQDLDAMEEVLDGYAGILKVQVAGPWTLAASLEQAHSLTPALADPGAVADIAASLAEGAAAHVAEVAKRVPGARIIVQYDEPSLPAVLEGSIPTPSGLSRVRAVDEEVVRERLRTVLSATGRYCLVHCCAETVPFGIVRGSGAHAISFELSMLKSSDLDYLAETAEAGLGLLLGIRGDTHTPATMARSVADAWRRMGLPPATCAPQVVITPACGLAAESPHAARAALKRVREAARILPEIMEEQRLWSSRKPVGGTRSSTRRCSTPSTGTTCSTRPRLTMVNMMRGSGS